MFLVYAKDSEQFILLCIRRGKTPRHRYKHGFSGFAAHLSEDEARIMAKQPGVVSVFPDQMLQLHTTRSWDFLVQESYQRQTHFTETNSQPDLDVAQGDTIIGFIDSGEQYASTFYIVPRNYKTQCSILVMEKTGIWPESQSFSDRRMGPVPAKWKGTCMRGKKTQPDSFLCNR